MRFRLIQALSMSNIPTLNFTVLCYGLLCSLDAWLRCVSYMRHELLLL
jgi:hypothetical protein